jgi:hypothetical protein
MDERRVGDLDSVTVMAGRLWIVGNDRDNRGVQIGSNRPDMEITHTRVVTFHRAFDLLHDTCLLFVE